MATPRKRPPGGVTEKELAARAADYAAHGGEGGLIILRGGYWDGNVLWRSDFEAMPVTTSEYSKRRYEPTAAFEKAGLEGYGRVQVYRRGD